MRSIVVLFALSLYGPLAGAQTTYYVSESIGSDVNPGTSPGAPWQTLFRVSAAALSPGDQVLLKAGDTWLNDQLVVTTSGVQGAPIRFAAFGVGPRPVIDQMAALPAVRASGASDLIIETIHTRNGMDGIALHQCDRVLVSNCEIEAPSRYGVLGAGAPGLVTVESCDIHRCGVDGINAYITAFVVRNCYIHDLLNLSASSDAIALHDSYSPVSQIYGNTLVGPFNKAGISGAGVGAGAGANATRYVAHANFVTGARKYGFIIKALGSTGLVYNNIIVVPSFGMSPGAGLSARENALMEAYNNTVINLNTDDDGPSFHVASGAGITARNNISICASNESLHWQTSSTSAQMPSDHNLYWPDDDPLGLGGRFDLQGSTTTVTGWQALGHDPNAAVGHPLLLGGTMISRPDDARLGVTSPAIGSGEDLSAHFVVDFAGVTRPVGLAWDIGALKRSPSWGPLTLSIYQGAALDAHLEVNNGPASQPVVNFFSLDPLNTSSPGWGWLGGLHIPVADAVAFYNLGVLGIAPFGGVLDATGHWSTLLPSAAIAGLSGLTLHGISAYDSATGPVFTSVTSRLVQ